MAWFSSMFSNVSSCEENICSLSAEMDELKSRRMDIQQRVDVAEREGQARTNQVEWWLGRVEALEKDALAVDAAYQQSSCRCFCFDAWSIYLLSVKAATKKAEAVELKCRGDFCQVAYDLIPVRFVAVPNTPTIGMESKLEKLTRHVGDDEVGIIGIHGMGGVGKSALLKRFHNEFLVGETDLDLVIMMEVSNPFDEEDVQRAIGARLGLQWVATRAVEERAVILFNVLLERKFVLILDNLWRPLDLEMVGVPIPAAGSKSKIIVASRVESVCNLMDAKKMIRVECLRWEEAWELFLDKAGSGAELIHSHPGINKYAEEIANKCGGLPLALITIARASASNKTIEEWESDAAILDREPWKIQGMLHRHLRRSLTESRKLVAARRACEFLYIGTMEPERGRARGESNGGRAPSPELQPLPPLTDPAQRRRDPDPTVAVSSDDDEFYTPQLSLASMNSESPPPSPVFRRSLRGSGSFDSALPRSRRSSETLLPPPLLRRRRRQEQTEQKALTGHLVHCHRLRRR